MGGPGSGGKREAVGLKRKRLIQIEHLGRILQVGGIIKEELKMFEYIS